MGYYKGKDFVVTFNSGVIASKTSVDINLETDVIDVTNADSNSAEEIIAGASRASIAVDGLVTDSNVTSIIAIQGTEAVISAVLGASTISFSALCTNVNITGEAEDRVEFSAEFRSNGAITK